MAPIRYHTYMFPVGLPNVAWWLSVQRRQRTLSKSTTLEITQVAGPHSALTHTHTHTEPGTNPLVICTTTLRSGRSSPHSGLEGFVHPQRSRGARLLRPSPNSEGVLRERTDFALICVTPKRNVRKHLLLQQHGDGNPGPREGASPNPGGLQETFWQAPGRSPVIHVPALSKGLDWMALKAPSNAVIL